MEHLAFNLLAKAKRVTRGGRSYLVAPATLIVPGVLNGSEGPIFYSAEENARNPADWNGMPIVVYHPVRGGRSLSARDPDVAEKQQVGVAYRTKVANDGRLQAELWFDEQDTRRVDNRIIGWLQEGKQIELSTGLYLEKERADNGANHKGRSYLHVAKNYKPDHIAVLPDQRGACSIEDGCGVLVNSEGKVILSDGWQPLENQEEEPAGEQSSKTKKGAECECGAEDCEKCAGTYNQDDIDPDKACEILKDGTVHGEELTEAQRGFFGARCGERTENAWRPLKSLPELVANSASWQEIGKKPVTQGRRVKKIIRHFREGNGFRSEITEEEY